MTPLEEVNIGPSESFNLFYTFQAGEKVIWRESCPKFYYQQVQLQNTL